MKESLIIGITLSVLIFFGILKNLSVDENIKKENRIIEKTDLILTFKTLATKN